MIFFLRIFQKSPLHSQQSSNILNMFLNISKLSINSFLHSISDSVFSRLRFSCHFKNLCYGCLQDQYAGLRLPCEKPIFRSSIHYLIFYCTLIGGSNFQRNIYVISLSKYSSSCNLPKGRKLPEETWRLLGEIDLADRT